MTTEAHHTAYIAEIVNRRRSEGRPAYVTHVDYGRGYVLREDGPYWLVQFEGQACATSVHVEDLSMEAQ